jgi:hypothetical protein
MSSSRNGCSTLSTGQAIYPVESGRASIGVWSRDSRSPRGVWSLKQIVDSKSFKIACAIRLQIADAHAIGHDQCHG